MEEIQELNDSIIWWQNRFNAVNRDNKQLQNKIDKAIEILESNSNSEWEDVEHIDQAIEILKGNNNE